MFHLGRDLKSCFQQSLLRPMEQYQCVDLLFYPAPEIVRQYVRFQEPEQDLRHKWIQMTKWLKVSKGICKRTVSSSLLPIIIFLQFYYYYNLNLKQLVMGKEPPNLFPGQHVQFCQIDQYYPMYSISFIIYLIWRDVPTPELLDSKIKCSINTFFFNLRRSKKNQTAPKISKPNNKK